MVYGARAGDALDGRSVRRLLLIAYGIIFSGVQANAVARALSFSFDFPPLVTGIILAVFALLAITRGLHGVARLMQGFVPLMAIIWVLTSLVICVMNIGQLPHVIWSIFESAFGWQEAAGGAAGYTLSQAITNGFQRSMFSNEAEWGRRQRGSGSGVLASASRSARNCPDDWHFYRHHGHLYGKRHADITGG